MRAPASRLHQASGGGGGSPSPSVVGPGHGHAHAGGEQAIPVDSDAVVVLASLLCALVCVVGLALVARCACRRVPAASGQAPKGLRKKAIEALPTVSLCGGGGREAEGGGGAGECGICLAELTPGDRLRVLPRCAHAFHVACVDTWLGAHASCPSCRAAVTRACDDSG